MKHHHANNDYCCTTSLLVITLQQHYNKSTYKYYDRASGGELGVDVDFSWTCCKTPAHGSFGIVARDRTLLKVTRYKHTSERIYIKLDLLKHKSTKNPQQILPVDVDYKYTQMFGSVEHFRTGQKQLEYRTTMQ